ncbi:MFS transporter [Roseiarcus sp.]|uniref:MFS transporter n=1 Tax=Roseiarcus sp. TaxID=1969460 RepID=UPI003F975D5B
MTAAASLRDVSWRERAAVTAVFLVLGIGIGAWAAAIPAFKARLGISDGQLALALFAFAAGAILAMLGAAALAGRFGPAKATRIAALLFSGSLLLPALAGNLAALAGAVFVLGVANGLLDVNMNGYASRVEGRWGAAIMSSFHAAFSAGGIVGAALGLGLARTGAAGMLGAAAALALALLFWAWPALRDGEAAPAPPAGFARPIRAALPLCAIAALFMICEGAMADWTGVYLADVVRAPQALAAIGYAAFSAAMVAGRLAGDGAVRALGRARVVGGGAALAAAGLTLAVAVPGLGSSSIGFALVGLGLSNGVPAVFSAAAGLTASPAVGVAMAATAGYAGFLGGPVAIGAVAEGFGLRIALAALIALAAAAALTARALRPSPGR